MCSSVSSTGNDLGVWYFKCDGRWTCLSVHLHRSQHAPGTPPSYEWFENFGILTFSVDVVHIYIFTDATYHDTYNNT